MKLPPHAPGGEPALGLDPKVAANAQSYTGQYLKQLLDRRGGAGSRGKRTATSEAAE